MTDGLISLEDAIETIAGVDITDGTEPVFSGKQVVALLKDLDTIKLIPKGHGRLIDADELYDSLKFPTEQFARAFKEILDDAPTIIEADIESENKE